MRNDVYERMKHFVIEDIKPNYTAIARQYGVDPRTVKAAYLRALNGQDPSYNHQRHRRRSKLDEYRDIIESKYAAGCSARSIFDFIVEKGFTGKYTIVKDYCRCPGSACERNDFAALPLARHKCGIVISNLCNRSPNALQPEVRRELRKLVHKRDYRLSSPAVRKLEAYKKSFSPDQRLFGNVLRIPMHAFDFLPARPRAQDKKNEAA